MSRFISLLASRFKLHFQLSKQLSGDFTRLVLRNRVAQVLFSDSVAYVEKIKHPIPDTDAEDSRFKSIEQAC